MTPRPRPDVLVVSRVVLDEFRHGAGELAEFDPRTRVVLGGSGFWAAFGAALYSDEVAHTSKVGPDFAPFAPLYADLGIRTDGLVQVDRPTSRTVVTYPEPEERHEEPLPSWEAHVAMRTVAEEFPEPVRDPRAYYVFRGWHEGFWEGLDEARSGGDSLLLWEIPGAVCTPADVPRVREVLATTSVLSLNLAEARGLCGDLPETALLEALHGLGAPRVALRLGARGAILSDGEDVVWARPPVGFVPVDVTGGGNSFCGALTAALLLTPDDAALAVSRAVAASLVAISQVGAPPDLKTARASARHHLGRVVVRDVVLGEGNVS